MKIVAMVAAIASFIALTILLGEAVFFRVATEISSLVTPIVGLIIIVLQIQNWVNIRKIELKTTVCWICPTKPFAEWDTTKDTRRGYRKAISWHALRRPQPNY